MVSAWVNKRGSPLNQLARSPTTRYGYDLPEVNEDIGLRVKKKEMSKAMNTNDIISACGQMSASAIRIGELIAEIGCDKPECAIGEGMKETYTQFCLDELEHVQVMALLLTDLLAGEKVQDAEDVPLEEPVPAEAEAEDEGVFAPGELNVEKKPEAQPELPIPVAPKEQDKNKLEISQKPEKKVEEEDSEEITNPADPAQTAEQAVEEEDAEVNGMSDSTLRKLIKAIAEALGDKPTTPPC